MKDDDVARVGRSRRWFVGAAAVTAGSLLLRGTWSRTEQTTEPVRFFDVVTDPTATVSITNGDEFTVAVKDRSTGEVLEQHDRVTAHTLLRLRSEYVQIVERSGP